MAPILSRGDELKGRVFDTMLDIMVQLRNFANINDEMFIAYHCTEA